MARIGRGFRAKALTLRLVPPATGATAITLSGPSGGVNGVASTNFTVAANGTITGTVTVTPTDSSGAGTFTPSTVNISSGSPTGTFTYTPSSVGARNINCTNNGSLSSPSNVVYTATSSAKYTRVDATDGLTGRAIMILVPNSNSAVPYNAANPTKTIIYAHGNGEDEGALLGDSLKATCVDALLDAGYILAGTADAGWGSQASVDAHAALEQYLRANYNVVGIGLWSQSAGGLCGLSSISQQKITGVVGWLGTYPVCSLLALHSGTGGTDYSSTIDPIYGITGVGIATYANLSYGLDPLLKWGSAFRSVPMRFYASAGDTVVGKTQNTDAFHTLISTSCRESTVVVCTGNHGDPSHFIPSEYVAFFDRCFATVVATSGIIGSGGSTGIGIVPSMNGRLAA